MDVKQLLERLQLNPESVEFEQVMEVIAAHYRFTATGFRNGSADDFVDNAAGTNEGSCKVFAFAQLHGLDMAQTLACFGRYYREDVLQHPEGTDHANIRSFMRHGPAGISIAAAPLAPRARD